METYDWCHSFHIQLSVNESLIVVSNKETFLQDFLEILKRSRLLRCCGNASMLRKVLNEYRAIPWCITPFATDNTPVCILHESNCVRISIQCIDPEAYCLFRWRHSVFQEHRISVYSIFYIFSIFFRITVTCMTIECRNQELNQGMWQS